MRRNVKKQFWLSKEEAHDLKMKAQRTCLTEAALIRLLLRGYEPKERPDERFYEVMNELSIIGNEVTRLSEQASSLGYVDAESLEQEAKRWNQLQSEIERQYLRPKRSERKWQ